MGRHSDQSTVRAWADVFRDLAGALGPGATRWIVVVFFSLIPAVVVGGIWFILFADLAQNTSGAATTAAIVAFATFVAAAAAGVGLTRSERSKRSHRHRKV